MIASKHIIFNLLHESRPRDFSAAQLQVANPGGSAAYRAGRLPECAGKEKI